MVEQWITNKLINSPTNSMTAAQKKDLTYFSKPTEGYDHCGIYDFVSPQGGDPPEIVGVPSEFEPWGDAIKMLNWINNNYYDGFEVVLIDDVAEKNPYKTTTNTNCFTMSQKSEKDRGYFEYNKFV